MPHLEDDNESYWYERRIPGRFYASKTFPQGSAHAAEVGPDVVLPACRFAYQKISDDGEVVFEGDNGWEIVIRETPSGQQLSDHLHAVVKDAISAKASLRRRASD